MAAREGRDAPEEAATLTEEPAQDKAPDAALLCEVGTAAGSEEVSASREEEDRQEPQA